MGKDVIIYLIVIWILSLTFFLLLNKRYNFNKIFLVFYALFLTLFGALSTMLLAYIESGKFGGISYFGAVFFLPIFLILFVYIFKLKNTAYLFDLMSIMGCITLAVMKVRCYIANCCSGRILFYHSDLTPFIFPSQIVEGINGIIILIILLIISRNNKNKGSLYLYFMWLYGITRFILSFFRYYKPVFWIFSYGHIWALCSFIISSYIFYCIKHHDELFVRKQVQ